VRTLFVTTAFLATAAGFVTPGFGQARERVKVQVRVDSVNPLMTGFVTLRRAHLGLTVNLRAGETDQYGALINSVSPNGPADKAGIRSGDVVVSIDGESLLDRDEGVVVEEGSSAPGLTLIALAARLEPEDTVPVILRRDGSRLQVSVVTESWPSLVREWRSADGELGVEFGADSLVVDVLRSGPRVRTRFLAPSQNMFFSGALFDLELAPMNPDLGRYFGTSEGVLVIRVPESSGLRLQGGDVVLAVDGRPSTSPVHLHRILRSYESEETFRLTIMRNQKRQTVEGTLKP
jgi:S1-C subfamily serine protease